MRNVEPTIPSQLLQKTRVTSSKDENCPNIGGGWGQTKMVNVKKKKKVQRKYV